jgi:hypothetical protein
MKYPYLVASLPALTFGAPPPMSLDRFRALCREQLTSKDYAELDALLEGGPARSGFVQTWRHRETQLRNAVARARAARRSVEVRPYLREHAGFDVALERAVSDAMSHANPLEREMELEHIRWHLAEELARFHEFDLEGVLSYALRLRIAERLQGWNEGLGRRRVDEWQDRAAERARAAGLTGIGETP